MTDPPVEHDGYCSRFVWGNDRPCDCGAVAPVGVVPADPQCKICGGWLDRPNDPISEAYQSGMCQVCLNGPLPVPAVTEAADPRIEAAAEAMFEEEYPKWSPTAHADHNRWSWRGDGHGEVVKQEFRDRAKAAIAGADAVDPLRRTVLDAEIRREPWKEHYEVQQENFDRVGREWERERQDRAATIKRWRDRAEAAEAEIERLRYPAVVDYVADGVSASGMFLSAPILNGQPMRRRGRG